MLTYFFKKHLAKNLTFLLVNFRYFMNGLFFTKLSINICNKAGLKSLNFFLKISKIKMFLFNS